jgi:hypothetical protein
VGSIIGLGLICVAVQLIVVIVMVVSVWILFERAGRPGWAALIPFYNTIVFLDIIDKPWWHLFFLMIPFVNIYFGIVYTIEFVQRYGGSVGFAIGVLLLGIVFLPLMAFGDYPYQGRRSRSRKRLSYDEDDDERPRSRSRPRRLEYDDEEDRPRKKPRRLEYRDDDDDEEEERRPPPKKKSSEGIQDRPRRPRPRDEDEDEDDDSPPRRRR